MAELGAHLSKHIDGGRNIAAVAFAIRLLRTALIDEHSAPASDCAELLAALSKLAHSPNPPDGLLPLLDDVSRATGSAGVGVPIADVRAAVAARALPTPSADSEARASEQVPSGGPSGAQSRARSKCVSISIAPSQVAPLWADWLSIFAAPSSLDKAHVSYLSSLHAAGWLTPGAQGEAFMRCITDAAFSASVCASDADPNSKPPLSFGPLDALSKLVGLVIKFVPGDPAPGAARDRAQLGAMSIAIAAAARHLLRAYETVPASFNQRAYLRLFGSLLFELNGPVSTST